MELEKFLKMSISYMKGNVRPPLYCKDGFSFSLQGSSVHYCSPRTITDHYFNMEIGYPSCFEPLIHDYAETPQEPTATVYPRVPFELIQKLIQKHGGIDFKKSLGV